jgi:hypothetical protein
MAEETKTVDAIKAPEETKTVEDTKAIEAVKERLNFFFSDANVRQDLFIRRLLTKTDEKSVPVECLLRFNTVKRHTEDPTVVIQAAKELTDLLVVDEEKCTISRVVPFTDGMTNQNIPKSLYIKNLPMKEMGEGDKKSNQYDVNIGEIRAIFAKYGDVALVKLRFSTTADDGDKREDHRDKRSKRNKFPIGAVVVEFHKQEDLDKAADATLTTKNGEKVDPKEKTTLVESETRKSTIELDVMLLSEYVESRKEGKGKKSSDSNSPNNKKRNAPEEEKAITKFTFDWKPGCVIQVRGLPDGCDREAMLSAVAKGLDISVEGVKTRKVYVDYSRGQKDGAIRFPEPSDSIAEISKKLNDGELTIMDTKLENALVLEGEEEKKYWDNFIEFKNKQIVQRHEEKRSHRGPPRGPPRGGKRQKR